MSQHIKYYGMEIHGDTSNIILSIAKSFPEHAQVFIVREHNRKHFK